MILGPPIPFHIYKTPHCPSLWMSLVSQGPCLLFCAQTGFIRIGEESMFIEPLDENDPLQSFSGLKHRLLRQRRSAKNSSAPENEEPSYCGTIRGKCRGLMHLITHIGFYQMQIKSYWSLRGRHDITVLLHLKLLPIESENLSPAMINGTKSNLNTTIVTCC